MHQSVIRNVEIVIGRILALGSKPGNLGDIREHSLLTIDPLTRKLWFELA